MSKQPISILLDSKLVNVFTSQADFNVNYLKTNNLTYNFNSKDPNIKTYASVIRDVSKCKMKMFIIDNNNYVFSALPPSAPNNTTFQIIQDTTTYDILLLGKYSHDELVTAINNQLVAQGSTVVCSYDDILFKFIFTAPSTDSFYIHFNSLANEALGFFQEDYYSALVNGNQVVQSGYRDSIYYLPGYVRINMAINNTSIKGYGLETLDAGPISFIVDIIDPQPYFITWYENTKYEQYVYFNKTDISSITINITDQFGNYFSLGNSNYLMLLEFS